MSQQGALHVLNTLATELQNAVKVIADTKATLAHQKQARRQYQNAARRADQLGYVPKFNRTSDGSVVVTFEFKKHQDEPQQMYHYGDVDLRGVEEQVAQRLENLPPAMAATKAIIRDACGTDRLEEGFFYREYKRMQKESAAERERRWLLDERTEIVIYADGEVLVDTHDEYKTRLRERLHQKGEGVSLPDTPGSATAPSDTA